MTLTTRKPTNKPSWPILLIAGGEKAGKSWACAQASASTKVGRTLWLSIGEKDPDEYGAIPGADFEIIEHDGSYKGILEALADVASLPKTELPTLLVVDSMTRLWDLITDNAQSRANGRPKNVDNVITMDLWNQAKSFWSHIVKALYAHDGPVLLTARLENVTVVENGKPTALRADKIKTEKTLPYDVDGVIEMPERGKVFISGVRSVSLQIKERTLFPDFTIDGLWDKLGLTVTSPRTMSEPIRDTDDVEHVDGEAVTAA
jgi:hypothetical protein